MNLNINNVLIRPILTEKTDRLESQGNKVVFHVAKDANKAQIKDAVVKIFNVRVEKVNTQVVMGKRKRVRGAYGMESDWKKAIVTLHKEDRLEFPSVS